MAQLEAAGEGLAPRLNVELNFTCGIKCLARCGFRTRIDDQDEFATSDAGAGGNEPQDKGKRERVLSFRAQLCECALKKAARPHWHHANPYRQACSLLPSANKLR